MLVGFEVTSGRGSERVYQNPQTRSSEDPDGGTGLLNF
jgi:hypothetical protein